MRNSEWFEQARDNTSELQVVVLSLETDCQSLIPSGEFRKAKEKVNQVFETFKTLKPTLQRERESLWERFSSVRDRLRRVQSGYWEKRRENSLSFRKEIEKKISEAKEIIGWARTRDNFDSAKGLIEEAALLLRSTFTIAIDDLSFESKMTKEDNDAAYELVKSARDELRTRRENVQRENYERLSPAINRLLDIARGGQYREVFEGLRNLKDDLRTAYFDKGQRDELYSLSRDVRRAALEAKRDFLVSLRADKKSYADDLDYRIQLRWKNVPGNGNAPASLLDQEDKLDEVRDKINSLDEQIAKIEEELGK